MLTAVTGIRREWTRVTGSGTGIDFRNGIEFNIFYYDAYVTFKQLSMCGVTARSQPICLVNLIVEKSRYHGRGYIRKAPSGLRH